MKTLIAALTVITLTRRLQAPTLSSRRETHRSARGTMPSEIQSMCCGGSARIARRCLMSALELIRGAHIRRGMFHSLPG